MYQRTTIAPVAVGNAKHVWKVRAVRCRAAVEPEVYISAGAMQHLHAACIYTHVASYQPGAVGVQTVSINSTTAVWVEIIQIVFLTMATERFSQAAKRRQQYARMSYLPAVC